MALLDRVILPTALWGLESVPLTTLQGPKLDALHRSLVARSLTILRRPSAGVAEYMRRRERLTTAAISRHSRAKYSDLQRYRVLSFFGHVAHSNPNKHACAQVLLLRSERWWAQYQVQYTSKTGGQPGRRQAHGSAPGHWDRIPREAFQTEQPAEVKRRIMAAAARYGVDTPRFWEQVACSRAAWRMQARWRVFHTIEEEREGGREAR